MDCIDPTQITPDDLAAYAGGEADTGVAAHVAACAACAAEAAAYATLDRALRARLYRVDCPAAQTLADLAADLLSPQEAHAVGAHLALCPHCTGELAALRAGSEARGERPSAASVVRTTAARILARLVPAPAPLLAAGIRGEEEHGSRVYEAAGLTLFIAEEPTSAGGVRHWELFGLALAEHGEGAATGSAVRLLRNGQVAQETALDGLGNFVFEGLEAGSYELELDIAGAIIAIADFAVGAGAA